MLSRIFLLILVTGTFNRCIRDGEIDCITSAKIYLKVDDSQSRIHSKVNQLNVNNATVYIFNSDSILERIVQMSSEDIELGKPIEITYDELHPPLVIAWGNLNNSQEITEIEPGMKISSARINMLKAGAYTIPPDELYYGNKELTPDEIQEVVIAIWIGRVSITVRGIDNASSDTDHYYFTIESNYNGYDFNGLPQSGKAIIKVDAQSHSSKQGDVLIHQPVNIMAYPVIPGQRQPIIVRLYKMTDTEDTLIAKADTDIEGNRIVTHSGENTNVLFDFTDNDGLSVHLLMTPWDYIYQWVEW